VKIKDLLSTANLNFLPALLARFAFGKILSALPRQVMRAAVNLNPTDMIAAVDSIKLPDDAKAISILYAVAVTGSGTKGVLTVDAGVMTTAPAAGHCQVTASRDIAFADADAWTGVDLVYQPLKLDVVELTLPVVGASGVLTIPTTYAGRVVVLEEATVLTATAGVGVCKVVTTADTNAGTTLTANLNLAKTTVLFRAADAVTSAKVKLGLVPVADVHALLESEAT
jgi:hypothetical protein